MALLTPEFLQTSTYSALRDRLVLAHGASIQEGVWAAADFKAAQRAAGANMSVDVPAGYCLVTADYPGNKNGLFHIENDATINVPQATAANATNPRLDQLVLTINDQTHGGAPNNTPTLSWLTGTPNAGTTLDTRTGAAGVGLNQIRLADVLVPAATTSMTTANIRDRRPWARGAFYYVESDGSGNLTVASGSSQSLSSKGLGTPRIELSGGPVEVYISGVLTNNTAATNTIIQIFMDNALQTYGVQGIPTAGFGGHLVLRDVLQPAAGSHVFDVRFSGSTGGTVSAWNDTDNRFRFLIREILADNTSNT